MGSSNKTKKIWDRTISKYWEETLSSPWRPSTKDVKNYRKGLKKIKSTENIFILGATPELRILANQFGKQIWVADHSLKMILEMNELIGSINLKKEKFIPGDWHVLKNSLKIKSLDGILGDLVLRLITKKRKTFLKMISELLKPEGVFITRIHFIDESLTKLTVEEIIEEGFFLQELGMFRRGMELKNSLISRILDRYYLFGISDIKRRVRDDINNYLTVNSTIGFDKEKILKGVFNRFDNKRLSNFFPQTKKAIEKEISTFFKIEDKLIASDYVDAEFFPVYILRPRS